VSKIHIFTSKFSHPKNVIAYMDTGAPIRTMNPSILNTICKTNLMTKEKIRIIFFSSSECIAWIKVIERSLPNNNIDVGMDVYSATNTLQILPTWKPKEFQVFDFFLIYGSIHKLVLIETYTPDLRTWGFSSQIVAIRFNRGEDFEDIGSCKWVTTGGSFERFGHLILVDHQRKKNTIHHSLD